MADDRVKEEDAVYQGWHAWAAGEWEIRQGAADRARRRALRDPDTAAWKHAETIEIRLRQLEEMIVDDRPYFASVRATLTDHAGERVALDVRVHAFTRAEAFPGPHGEMVAVSHLSPIADLVRNPAEPRIALALSERDLLRWPELRGVQLTVDDAMVEDVEIEGGRVTRVAPRFGAIFEDRVRKRLSEAAMPGLGVLADVLDRRQSRILNDRDPKWRLVILDGPAGTGKTVVAAHRIALVAPEDSAGVYVTPTATFREYISPALPRFGLGRRGVRAVALSDIARSLFPDWPWDDVGAPLPPVADETALEKLVAHLSGAEVPAYLAARKHVLGAGGAKTGPADVVPALLLAARLGRTIEAPRPAWAVIDEVQVFPLVALRALATILGPIPIVAAGDLLQRGPGEGIAWKGVSAALGVKATATRRLWLSDCYRIPPAIHAAAERVRRALDPEGPVSSAVAWHPEPGRVIRHEVETDEVPSCVDGILDEAHADGVASVAVVAACPQAGSGLVSHFSGTGRNVQVLDGRTAYRGGVALADVEVLRGLEFDWVILADTSVDGYPAAPAGGRALYVAATRARRRLDVVVAGGGERPASPWVEVLTGRRNTLR